jgi:hypothetical protein
VVFRPPLRLRKKADDNPNLCAYYVELRTPIGRREVAEKLIMRTLPTPGLTRLVLVVHGEDYEFRRNIFTGVTMTGEISITRDNWHAGMEFGKIEVLFFHLFDDSQKRINHRVSAQGRQMIQCIPECPSLISNLKYLWTY